MSKILSPELLFFLIIGSTAQASFRNRILGGSEAREGQFPHQISLRPVGASHICGGSIISRNFVLTAAHCVAIKDKNGVFQAKEPKMFTVLAGSSNRFVGGVVHGLVSVTVHEDYTGVLNDVALLGLEKPLNLTEQVQPIPLPRAKLPAGSPVTISGWGRSDSGFTPFQLQWLQLSSITEEQCFEDIGILSSKLICLSHAEKQGACMGDSGGPATNNGELVGVAGFVIGGCGTSKPDGYASVFSHVPWIKKNSDL